MRSPTLLLLALFSAGTSLSAEPGAQRGDPLAGLRDGKAELSGYRLLQPRYGQPREGTAVMIWVTEPFSRSKHVKLDDWQSAGADRVEVMKLNFTKDFLTGIYPYHVLTSVFSPLRPEGGKGPVSLSPIKVSFGGQEWCGNVYMQLDRRDDALFAHWHSYFESEGDGQATLKLPGDTLFEDELWFRVRELSAELRPGRYALVPSLYKTRIAHQKLALQALTVTRKEAPETRTVPFGTFETTRFDLDVEAPGQKPARTTIWVERAPTRRIVAWERDVPGLSGPEPEREHAELTGSIRDPYWRHNRKGDEALRKKLGLP